MPARAREPAAAAAFERGEADVHDAIDATAVAVDAWQAAAAEGRRQQERKWAI